MANDRFSRRHRKLLASALRHRRTMLSEALFIAVREKACANWSVPQTFEEVKEWGRSLLLTAVDLLTAWFETGDPLYRELFVGWVHSRIASSLSEEAVPSDYKPGKAVEFAKTAWIAALKTQVPAEAIQIFEAALSAIVSCLSNPPLKSLRILFIGDCLQFEVTTALVGPCIQAQVAIEPKLINERMQSALRNRIRALSPDQFDLVFFSPFSHSYLPEYEVLLKPGSRLWSVAKTAGHVSGMLQEVCSTLDALANRFHCPIYVHNTAATVQSFGRISGVAKYLISRRNRKRAREMINDGIARYLQSSLRESRVRLLDEDALRASNSESELGQVYLNSYSLHPTRLGVDLGRGLYFEAVYTAAYLAGKKVVVCDLDNTLWEGLIGEGAVIHNFERQAVLKALRRRGVLLSINSKNDPNNVHWSGATLQPEDFVATRINWDSKVANMASIRNQLNLQMKDFVFIDDRPDELWRMQNAFPEVLGLDATQPESWKFLSHWQKNLSSDQEEDRTRLYHERAERQQFLGIQPGEPVSIEDEAAALIALKLSVTIEETGRSGLKRAVELINRTNQFNLCGSRTSVPELEEGLGKSHWLITVKADDKFGSMGVVGVMRVDWKPGRVEVPIFVLSCRAFGFGIEYALLNSVKTLVPGDYEIVGHYKETQFNEPCRQLYPASAMFWSGENWMGRVGKLPNDPAWLTIENGIVSKRLAPERGSQS